METALRCWQHDGAPSHMLSWLDDAIEQLGRGVKFVPAAGVAKPYGLTLIEGECISRYRIAGPRAVRVLTVFQTQLCPRIRAGAHHKP